MDGLRQAWSEYGFWGFAGTIFIVVLLVYGMVGYKSGPKKGGSTSNNGSNNNTPPSGGTQ